MSASCHSNHKHFVTALVDGLEANEAFMESLKAEHKCLLRFYSMCAEVGQTSPALPYTLFDASSCS